MSIKGVLFDFDGTLANTIDLIISTFEHTCKTVLGIVPSRQHIISTFGLPLADAMIKLSGSPDLVEEMRIVYRDYNNAHHDEMIRPILGVKSTLQHLKQRGIKIAVVTSKKSPMLQRGLNCLQIADYIDVVIALEDTKESKPHPEPMLKACNMLGLKPEECISIGDSPFDLQSGNRAGTTTIAVRYSYFPWQIILDEGKPDYSINNPEELISLIDILDSKEEK